jgi:Mg2+ and Co2+ transporter CorA
MLQALGQMRQSLVVVSRASAGNRTAIEYQVGRYQAAQADFTQAVDEINASR